MPSDSQVDLYVERALAVAALALDQLVVRATYDSNDLVAGALALDLLGPLERYAICAKEVAADLRELATKPQCAASVPGRAKAAKLAAIIQQRWMMDSAPMTSLEQRETLVQATTEASANALQRAAAHARREAWPGHCKACQASGGAAVEASREGSGGCDACSSAEQGTCSWCGHAQAVSDEGEGPRACCGWNHDDTCP
jgi:hypothetical protein